VRERVHIFSTFPDSTQPGQDQLVYETVSYGPYPFFRWREGNSPIYAVSLADTSVEMPERFRMGGFFAIRTRKGKTTIGGG